MWLLCESLQHDDSRPAPCGACCAAGVQIFKVRQEVQEMLRERAAAEQRSAHAPFTPNCPPSEVNTSVAAPGAQPSSYSDEARFVEQAWDAHMQISASSSASTPGQAGSCWPEMKLLNVHVHVPPGTAVRPGSPFYGCLVPDPVDLRGGYAQHYMTMVRSACTVTPAKMPALHGTRPAPSNCQLTSPPLGCPGLTLSTCVTAPMCVPARCNCGTRLHAVEGAT